MGLNHPRTPTHRAVTAATELGRRTARWARAQPAAATAAGILGAGAATQRNLTAIAVTTAATAIASWRHNPSPTGDGTPSQPLPSQVNTREGHTAGEAITIMKTVNGTATITDTPCPDHDPNCTAHTQVTWKNP